MFSGCGGLENQQFHLKSEDGKAVIEMGSVTLVFEGVTIDLPAGQSGGGAAGSLTVRGAGTLLLAL